MLTFLIMLRLVTCGMIPVTMEIIIIQSRYHGDKLPALMQ